MTIKQYQKLAKTIAEKIESLGSSPRTARHIWTKGTKSIECRDPKKSDSDPTSLSNGQSNAIVVFDCLSNPNNPNYKFRTLKPGSISAYCGATSTNVDLTEYNFDSSQFKTLIDCIAASDEWIVGANA